MVRSFQFPSRALIFADVHANAAALEAVLADAGRFDACYFLGDAVGFGPQPEACVRRLRELGPKILIRGNHDEAALRHAADEASIDEPLETGRAWEHWTARQLSDASLAFLREAVPECTLPSPEGDATFVHHPPDAPEPIRADTDEHVLAQAVRRCQPGVLWFGHTHVVVDRTLNGVRLLNPGAVGQSRDGSPLARYAVWENGQVHFHAVAYEVDRTLAALDEVPLAKPLRHAWRRNLREGIVGPGSS